MQELPRTAVIIGAAALGLILGSFITALSYRLPRGESIAHGRSKCPACGHALAARDLVPVVSWIVHRGACRHCGATVSWRYPAIELLTMAVFVAAAAATPQLPPLVLLLAMSATMIALAVIDLEHWRLPNGPMIVLGLLAVAWRAAHDQALGTAAIEAGGVFLLGAALNIGLGRLLKKPGFGMGDTKLLAIVGIALPVGSLLICIALASVVGVVFGLIWLRRTGSMIFPFGPAILASLWLGLLIGDRLLAWVAAVVT